MARAPRYFAIDDGPFTFGDPETALVGVLTRGASTVEAVAVDHVAVDGHDATEKVLGLVSRLPGAGPDALLVGGIAVGGFNILDLAALHEATGRPVVAVARRPPDRARMESAIRDRLPDPERRLARLPAGAPAAVVVAGRTLHAHGVGIDATALPALLAPAMAQGGIPEPLRLAHLIATAVGRGVSGSRA